MVGLVIGTVRMAIDFSYKAPLCMEKDTRPFWIGQVRCCSRFRDPILKAFFSQIHYMYFAAFLFWTTGIVAAVISLLTPPDEPFRVGIN